MPILQRSSHSSAPWAVVTKKLLLALAVLIYTTQIHAQFFPFEIKEEAFADIDVPESTASDTPRERPIEYSPEPTLRLDVAQPNLEPVVDVPAQSPYAPSVLSKRPVVRPDGIGTPQEPAEDSLDYLVGNCLTRADEMTANLQADMARFLGQASYDHLLQNWCAAAQCLQLFEQDGEYKIRSEEHGEINVDQICFYEGPTVTLKVSKMVLLGTQREEISLAPRGDGNLIATRNNESVIASPQGASSLSTVAREALQ